MVVARVTGQPPVGSAPSAGARDPTTARRRPFLVWCALAVLCGVGLLKVLVAVLAYALAPGRQLSGVPGNHWADFTVLMAFAVLQAVTGVFVFRGAVWAWFIALLLPCLFISGAGKALATYPDSFRISTTLIAIIPDAAAVGLLLTPQVRDWCHGPDRDGGEPPSGPAG